MKKIILILTLLLSFETALPAIAADLDAPAVSAPAPVATAPVDSSPVSTTPVIEPVIEPIVAPIVELAPAPTTDPLTTEETAPVALEEAMPLKESVAAESMMTQAVAPTEPIASYEAPKVNNNPLDSLKGFEGKFDTDLFTGAASFSFPIWTPSGRLGMQPSLSLSYSSTNGDFGSDIGYGWSLPISAIYRNTDRGSNKLYTDNAFSANILGSYDELISVSASTGDYAPKQEGSFSKYKFQNNTWTVTDKQGNKYTFGSTDVSRQNDSVNTAKVYKWMLEKVVDTTGNFMTFTYYKDSGQIYPATIRYTGNGTTPGNYEVRFVRELRATAYTSYSTGFSVVTKERIKAIEIYTYHEGTAKLARTFALSYNQTGNVAETLGSITVKGGDLAYPPIGFEYYDSKQGTAGQKPNLLKKIKYPLGGTVELTYKPSTAYRTPAQGLANTNLPFTIHTINQVKRQANNSASAYTTTYNYTGGHYFFDYADAFKKEYAGFQNVEIIDPVGNVTKTYFHQSQFAKDNADSATKGEFEDHIVKKGKIYRTESYDNAGKLFQVSISKWNKKQLTDDDAREDRFFTYLERTTNLKYDGLSSNTATAVAYVYDSYGNVTRTVDYGLVSAPGNNGDFTDAGSDRILVDVAYAQNLTANLIGYPTRVVTTNQANAVIGEIKYYYDNLTAGQISKGLVTKSEELISTGVYQVNTITYNALGLPISYTDPLGRITKLTYDSLNLFVSQVTNPKNQITKYEYAYYFGVPKAQVDPNNNRVQISFDSLGRPIEKQISAPNVANAMAIVNKYYYDLSARPAKISIDSYTGVTETAEVIKNYAEYYDGFSRVVQKRTETGSAGDYSVKDFVYNSQGQVDKESLAYFATGAGYTPTSQNNNLFLGYKYDALGRVVSQSNVLGETKNEYLQLTQNIIDPQGKIKTLNFDARGNLIQVTENNARRAEGVVAPEKYLTKYSYDALGNLIKITDALGNVRNFTYDLLGEVLKSEDLHAPADTTFGIYNYVYDKAGNLIKQTDPNGNVMAFTYDPLDRVLTKAVAGVNKATYTYDTCALGIGHVCTVVSPALTTNYTYNTFGLPATEAKTIDSKTYTTQFTYNRLGEVRIVVYPDNTNVLYSINPAGEIYKVLKKDPDTTAYTNVISNVTYNPLGQVTRQEDANGVVTVSTYDENQLYRLKNKITTNTAGRKLQDLSYVYDKVGNIIRIADLSATNTKKISDYGYDDLYRLVKASVVNSANNANYVQTYTYNALGNILNKSDVGAYLYAGNTGTNYANPHAVTSVAGKIYAYDKNGNLTSDSVWTHAWNFDNRLTSSTKGAQVVNYTYDEAGTRVKKSTGANVTYYVNDFYDIENGQIKRHILFNGAQVATVINPSPTATGVGVAYHHVDHLGGSSVETDQKGNLVETLDYYPFGSVRLDEKTAGYENDYKYTGKELDVDTGLMYYEARYYNAVIGRFVSEDPKNGDYTDPQSLNSYSYCRNNPLRYTDPNGESFMDYAKATAGYGVGFATSFASTVYNTVAHPIQTVKAVGNLYATGVKEGISLTRDLYTNPSKTLGEISTGMRLSYNEFETKSPYDQGKSIGKVFGAIDANVAMAKALDVSIKAIKPSSVKNVFPKDPADLMPELPRDAKGRIYPNSNTRIRVEEHGFEPGGFNAPRHADLHYHVDVRANTSISWNNKSIQTLTPPGWLGGAKGFLPGEKFPGTTVRY